VSLVPSLSEACFSVGLGPHVVGVTRWCVHPASGLAGLARVGGTRDPDVEAIAALAPDLVIANREENPRRRVEALERRGLRVWVTDVRDVAGGVALMRSLAALSPHAGMARAALEPVERAVAEARGRVVREARRPRVFCPIWRDPWMAVGGDTYASDLITLSGGRNVFGDGADHGDRRYPRVGIDEIVSAQPDVILLPDEPYAFGAADVRELEALDIPAARSGRIHPIDGTWVSWYGPRIAPAIRSVGLLLAPPPA